jgi:hypothetical protein
MTSNGYLAVKSFDLTLRLQALFQEYVDLNTQIHDARINKDAMSDECIELSLKLKTVVQEIGLIVKKIKHLQSETLITRNIRQEMLSTLTK